MPAQLLQIVLGQVSRPPEEDWERVLGFVFGCLLIVFGRVARQHYKRMQQRGLPAEGVVLRITGSAEQEHAVIRFVTHDNRWVTAETLSLNYSEGQNLPVLYSALNPEEFVVGSATASPPFYLFTIAGLLLMGYTSWLIISENFPALVSLVKGR